MANKTLVRAVAPTRICDIGGWTDTWFARYGAVFNIAVYPYVEVQISIVHGGRADRPITIYAENYGDTYDISPDAVTYEKHPLIEAAVRRMKLPDGHAFRIDIYSEAPPGASMGTSAAVSVALIGALMENWSLCEAKLLASLNHANIGGIYGFEPAEEKRSCRKSG